MELYSKLKYRPIELIINEYKKRNTKQLYIFINKRMRISDEFHSINEPIQLDNLERIVKNLNLRKIFIGHYVLINKKLYQILLSIIKEFRYTISIYITIQSTFIIELIKHIRASELIVVIVNVNYDELLDLLIFKLRNRDIREVSIFDHAPIMCRINSKYFEESDIKADQFGDSTLHLSLVE